MASLNKALQKRYQETLTFLKKVSSPPGWILDLGVPNPFSEIMKKAGREVTNTAGEDLETDLTSVVDFDGEVVMAFEILEHLLAPFNVLGAIKAKKVIVTFPLKLWFEKAYRNLADPRDRHFHDFEDWLPDWLLEKSGWTILEREKWISPSNQIGIRSFLRNITPRYYPGSAYQQEDHN